MSSFFIISFALFFSFFFVFFFFNDTATTEIYTLSLHDALPISERLRKNPAELETEKAEFDVAWLTAPGSPVLAAAIVDRKSTRLNPVTDVSRMPSSA